MPMAQVRRRGCPVMGGAGCDRLCTSRPLSLRSVPPTHTSGRRMAHASSALHAVCSSDIMRDHNIGHLARWLALMTAEPTCCRRPQEVGDRVGREGPRGGQDQRLPQPHARRLRGSPLVATPARDLRTVVVHGCCSDTPARPVFRPVSRLVFKPCIAALVHPASHLLTRPPSLCLRAFVRCCACRAKRRQACALTIVAPCRQALDINTDSTLSPEELEAAVEPGE